MGLPVGSKLRALIAAIIFGACVGVASANTVDTARAFMYVGEAADCLNTGYALQKPGTFETDPLVQPVARLGHTIVERTALVCGEFAAYDVIMGSLLRYSTDENKITFALSQIGNNVYGVVFTLHHTGR